MSNSMIWYKIVQQDKEIEALKKNLTVIPEPKATKGQMMASYEFFGILNYIDGLTMPQYKKHQLIQQSIEANETNIREDFNHRGFNLDSPLSTISNYNYIINFCKAGGMEGYLLQAQDRLNKIIEYKKNKAR